MEEVASDVEVTEEQLRLAVIEVVSTIDLALTSMKEIRRLLQEKFGGINLDDKKELIKEIVEKCILDQDDGEEEEKSANDDAHHSDEDGENSLQAGKPPAKKRGGSGFTKPLMLSEDLAAFIGSKTASRTEVTKRVWEYIKAQNLQNPANKREILCDTVLEKLMKRKKVTMFKMTKILNPMMKNMQDLQASCISEDEEDEDDSDDEDVGNGRTRGKLSRAVKANVTTKKRKAAEVDDEDSDDDDERKTGKRVKVERKSAAVKKETATKKKKKAVATEDDEEDSSKPGIYVNPVLLELLGLQSISTRPKLVKKLWEYIKSNNLQNEKDRREIILDEGLRSVFKVSKFTAFSMNKYLSAVLKHAD